MNKRLLILRHGKSDWANDKDSDFDRPLAPRGVEAAERMGRFLFEEDLIPELIVTSPAKRALNTAELVQEELVDVEIQEEDGLYEGDLDGLLSVIQGLSDELETVLLVGHNPGLEELVDELSGREDTVFKTCTLANLSGKVDSWSHVEPGTFKLSKLVHSASIGD